MKEFYSWPDVGFLKYLPNSVQHIVINDKASKLDGRITFYAAEDFETLATQEVIKEKIARCPPVAGIIFFTIKQFCYGEKFNYALLRDILESGYEVHFARENMSILDQSDLDEIFPMLYATQMVQDRDEPHESWRDVWDVLTPTA